MESCLKQRNRHCKDDVEGFSGKLVTFFYLTTEIKQTYLDVLPSFTKDEDRCHHLEPGQVKYERGWKSPLDMTTYTGLKENRQVIHCWIFVYKRNGTILTYSDKMYDAGSWKNSLHNLDGKFFIRLEPNVHVYYISYWKAQWLKSRLVRLENFHSVACQKHKIIFYLPWYAPWYGA